MKVLWFPSVLRLLRGRATLNRNHLFKSARPGCLPEGLVSSGLRLKKGEGFIT